MIKLITPKHLDKWGACDRDDGEPYDDATIARWLKGRRGLTPLEVANLKQVPPMDRLWVLLREDVLGAELHREAGHAFADRVVRKHALKHPSTREWAKRWLSPDRTTWLEAANAASAATNAAATWAVTSAARDARNDCATVAHAAWAAAWAAGATGSPERKWQLAWLRRRLRERGRG
jgi:hypothetical protein